MNGVWWNSNEVNIDDLFSYNIALNVLNDTEIKNQSQSRIVNKEMIGQNGKMQLR